MRRSPSWCPALFVGFAEGARPITTEDLIQVAKAVKPKGSDKVRPDFAREATSSTPVTTASRKRRSLDID